MMYFTRDIYEKMQIRGRFPLKIDNKEKWIQQLEAFCKVSHANDKLYNELIFQHIPEVKNDILEGKKFTDTDVSPKLYERIKEMANEWENVCSMCKAEYDDIKYKLPSSMQLLRSYAFHDNEVLSVKKDSTDVLIIELEYYSLIFKNVSQLEAIDDIVGDIWLYEEVHLSDIGGFEFQVLLYSPKGFLTLHEFSVIADDVFIEVKRY